MGYSIDLTGGTVGLLKIIRPYKIKNGVVWWLCRCDCGNQVAATADNLMSEKADSCGCISYSPHVEKVRKRGSGVIITKAMEDNKEQEVSAVVRGNGSADGTTEADKETDGVDSMKSNEQIESTESIEPIKSIAPSEPEASFTEFASSKDTMEDSAEVVADIVEHSERGTEDEPFGLDIEIDTPLPSVAAFEEQTKDTESVSDREASGNLESQSAQRVNGQETEKKKHKICTNFPNEALVGKRFNKLQVIAFAGYDKVNKRIYRCLCDCGNYTTQTASRLCRGVVKSCGCLRGKRKKKEEIGVAADSSVISNSPFVTADSMNTVDSMNTADNAVTANTTHTADTADTVVTANTMKEAAESVHQQVCEQDSSIFDLTNQLVCLVLTKAKEGDYHIGMNDDKCFLIFDSQSVNKIMSSYNTIAKLHAAEQISANLYRKWLIDLLDSIKE